MLFLALNLKKNAPPVKGYPTEIKDKVDYTLRFFHELLKGHIEKEEQILFPFLEGRADDIDELIFELKQEHIEIEASILSLNQESNQTSEFLHKLGVKLEQHVRKEERQLFQLVQAKVPNEQLLELNLT